MNSNWHIVYTKPQREKKVSSLLSAKGIENYLPFNNIIRPGSASKKIIHEPLFNSYIFVLIAAEELSVLNKIPDIHLVFWKNKPAIINKHEIEAVKSVTTNFFNIKLVKIAVNSMEEMQFKDEPVLEFNDKVVSVKYQRINIKLPSLGYAMIANRINEDSGAVLLISNKGNLLTSNRNFLLTS